MADTPSQDQLRTLCKQVAEALARRRQHLAALDREMGLTRTDIVNLQGALAALQVAIGEPYDPTLIAMDLNICTTDSPPS